MKIALVVPGGVDRSGEDKVIPCLLWQIERLAAGGDEVHVFALGQEPRSGLWPLLGAEVHNIGPRPRPLRAVAELAAEHRRGASTSSTPSGPPAPEPRRPRSAASPASPRY